MSRFFRDEGLPRSGQKVCLSTVSYGDPDAGYTYSIQSSREALHAAGIGTAYYLLQGNCHVDDARNRVAQAFLASDCTDLIFLDADVSWEPEDLVRLARHDRDLIGGVYPYRRENVDQIPARLIDGMGVDDDGLIEVEGLPTGFLKIRRHVFERMAPGAKSYVDTDHGLTYLFFERTLLHGTRWGGDLNFCNLWRALGGAVYADPEIVLGHTGIATQRASLGGQLRRRNRETLAYVCAKVRAGTHTARDLSEARVYADNPWTAPEELLAVAIRLAREANGPIIEAGSGLTTLLMASATGQTVFCLEHNPVHAAILRLWCMEAGIRNIGLCNVPVRDGWYDLSGFNGLPEQFALGVNDGPPRSIGDRMKFFAAVDCARVVMDDAHSYRAALLCMAAEHGRQVEFLTDRTAVIGPPGPVTTTEAA